MHVPTHILSDWVLGNLAPLRRGERLACMIAAAIPDLDGLGIVFGQDAYQRWHHIACHNLSFCVVTGGAMAASARRTVVDRLALFALYAAAFHLHLVMDYFGSGPGWPIDYLWPLADLRFVNWRAWELSSWQNTLAAGLLLAGTIGIAVTKRRTPLEMLMPSLDAWFVGRHP